MDNQKKVKREDAVLKEVRSNAVNKAFMVRDSSASFTLTKDIAGASKVVIKRAQ